MLKVVGYAFALVVVVLGSCTKPNPVVCCTDPNDCASIGLNTENERPCKDNLRCIDNVCTEVTACIDNADCSGSTPFCESGLCVECIADDNCSAAAPRCSEDHVCVECLQSGDCSTATPVCELSTQTCRPCQLDMECESNVCDAEMGTCIAESAVVYADPAGPTSTECSKSVPCSITSAFTVANVTREVIKLNPGTYTANIVVANKKVTVHGDGATLVGLVDDDTLVAQDRARLRVIGLVIVHVGNNFGPTAFECLTGVDKPVVELERVTLDSNRIAVTAGCTLTLSKSHVHVREGDVAVIAGDASVVDIRETLIDGPQGNGVEAFQGSVVRIVNSVIVGQTGSDGAFVGPDGLVLVSYSTIVDSVIECGTGVASCSVNAPHGVCIENSIILNTAPNAPANTITETACRVDFSLVRPQSTAPTGTNNMLGVDPLLVDVPAGDYHLQSTSPAIDAADPTATNPTDFDGILRPQGAANDLGAFERQ